MGYEEEGLMDRANIREQIKELYDYGDLISLQELVDKELLALEKKAKPSTTITRCEDCDMDGNCTYDQHPNLCPLSGKGPMRWNLTNDKG